jgi:nitroimidazol reductase NimA-like FMN-containing flavoprotein (pyridoxamine 5'-phosphate oxidase superfamily)
MIKTRIISSRNLASILSAQGGFMREMRRKDRNISQEECFALLERGQYGVLSTADENGLSYGVPLSYVFLGGNVHFHCAREGRKIDNLKANSAATFTVVGTVEPVFDKDFSTYYQSAIVSGAVREVADPLEKRAILYALAQKYLPAHLDKADNSINNAFSRTAVYTLILEHVTGKAKKPRPEAAPENRKEDERVDVTVRSAKR